VSADQEQAKALFFQGIALFDAADFAGAEARLRAALAIVPDRPSALSNLAAALVKQDKLAEAVEVASRATAIDPAGAVAWVTLAGALTRLRRREEALAAAEGAVTAAPQSATALMARASTYGELRDYARAIADYEAAYAINPNEAGLLGLLLAAKMHACEWRGIEALAAELLAGIRADTATADPFALLAVPQATARDHLLCARATIRREAPPQPAFAATAAYRHERLRIAYVSGDYFRHATTHLMSGVFEHHDRERFEITGVSFGPDDGTPERTRVVSAFDRFLDVRDLGPRQAAELIRRYEIDVAVDLGAFTSGGRLSIFAPRPAPVQATYLGYPGTTAAPYIDYIIADAIVLPPDSHGDYTEKVATLPDSYQANDDAQPIAATPTRAEAGLPANGFVFASFNNVYKIAPAVFDRWMQMLDAVPSSVLWLLETNAAAAGNLRREAAARGIDPRRIVLAPQLPRPEHLARQRLADLFLDTLPYNAHTTASDALWAGLPIVTCTGATFASRVAASLLTAVGLPELVTHSLDDYEALALRLAREPAELAALKAKLASNRTTTPLFDTAAITRHLEQAYATMVERHRRGEPPAAFVVPGEVGG